MVGSTAYHHHTPQTRTQAAIADNKSNGNNDTSGSDKKPATLGEIKRALGRLNVACQDASQHLRIDDHDGGAGQWKDSSGLQRAKAAIAEAAKEYGQLDMGLGW